MSRNIRQPASRALQFKPPVAQSKNAAAAVSIRRPAAPAVYRPQSKIVIAQPKKSTAAQTKTHPRTPPVYRPGPLPKILQTKQSVQMQLQKDQFGKQKAAPAVYRPQPSNKNLQPGMASGRVVPVVQRAADVKRAPAPQQGAADAKPDTKAAANSWERTYVKGNITYKMTLLVSAQNHYKDGWGEAYGITTDKALLDKVEAQLWWEGSVKEKGTWDKKRKKNYWEIQIKSLVTKVKKNPKEAKQQKGCNILYEKAWQGQNYCEVTVYHCGPALSAG